MCCDMRNWNKKFCNEKRLYERMKDKVEITVIKNKEEKKKNKCKINKYDDKIWQKIHNTKNIYQAKLMKH